MRTCVAHTSTRGQTAVHCAYVSKFFSNVSDRRNDGNIKFLLYHADFKRGETHSLDPF